MKTIELSTGTLLVVDRIEDAINIQVIGRRLLWDTLLFGVKTGMTATDPFLPADGFQLLGHPSEITGEVWGKVVEVFNGKYFEYVKDDIIRPSSFSAVYVFDTPLQSGLSLCAAHNIQESDVLLFKSKNK